MGTTIKASRGKFFIRKSDGKAVGCAVTLEGDDRAENYEETTFLEFVRLIREGKASK